MIPRPSDLLALLVLIGTALAPAHEPSTCPRASATLPAALTPGDHMRRMQADGRDRSYLIHIPPKHDPGRPAPVVLVFHGAGMNARAMIRFCGMNDKVDDAGFVAVYPNGTGIGDAFLTFNAWAKPPRPSADATDDVAFTANDLIWDFFRRHPMK